MGQYLSIGQFAKTVRLSVKALRRYDAEDLLHPARVDEETGYRYYTPEQTRDAVTIAMLRKLDVPIASIRKLLIMDGSERTQLLEKSASDWPESLLPGKPLWLPWSTYSKAKPFSHTQSVP